MLVNTFKKTSSRQKEPQNAIKIESWYGKCPRKVKNLKNHQTNKKTHKYIVNTRILLGSCSTLNVSFYSRSDHYGAARELSVLLTSSTYCHSSANMGRNIFSSAVSGKTCNGQHCCQHGPFPHFHALLLLNTGSEHWWLDSTYTHEYTRKSNYNVYLQESMGNSCSFHM